MKNTENEILEYFRSESFLEKLSLPENTSFEVLIERKKIQTLEAENFDLLLQAPHSDEIDKAMKQSAKRAKESLVLSHSTIESSLHFLDLPSLSLQELQLFCFEVRLFLRDKCFVSQNTEIEYFTDLLSLSFEIKYNAVLEAVERSRGKFSFGGKQWNLV